MFKVNCVLHLDQCQLFTLDDTSDFECLFDIGNMPPNVFLRLRGELVLKKSFVMSNVVKLWKRNEKNFIYCK